MDTGPIAFLNFIVELGAYLGSWLFYGGVILLEIVVYLSKYAFVLATYLIENAATAYAFLGYLSTSVFAYCSLFWWNFLLFSCGAFLHLMDFLSRFSVSTWNTPFFGRVRVMLRDVAETLLTAAWQSPMFTIRIVLVAVAVVLISLYGRDIWNLMVWKKNTWRRRILRTKDQMVARWLALVQFVLHPFAAFGQSRRSGDQPKGVDVFLIRIPEGVGQPKPDDRGNARRALNEPADSTMSPYFLEPKEDESDGGSAKKRSMFRNAPQSLASTTAHRDSKRNDLESEIIRLRNELHQEREARRCVVCLTAPREVVSEPCRHFATCEECFKELFDTCPLCRRKVRKVIKVFL